MGRIKEFAPLLDASTDHYRLRPSSRGLFGHSGRDGLWQLLRCEHHVFRHRAHAPRVVLGRTRRPSRCGHLRGHGQLIHESVTTEDFMAASFLMDRSLSRRRCRILKSLKKSTRYRSFTDPQRDGIQDFHGNLVGLSYVVMDRQAGGLAAVVEKSSTLRTSTRCSPYSIPDENGC